MPLLQRLRSLALLPILLGACAAPQPTSRDVTREQIVHMITRSGEIATWAHDPSLLFYHDERDAVPALGSVLQSLQRATGLRFLNAAVVLDYEEFRAANGIFRATSISLFYDEAHDFKVQMPFYDSATDQHLTGLVRHDEEQETLEAIAVANIAIVALRPDRARSLYATSAWFDPDDEEHMDFMRGRNNCRVITRSEERDGDRRIVAAYVFISRVRGQNLENCLHEELIHAIAVGDDAEGQRVFGFNSEIPMTETQRANDLCMLEEIYRETDPEPAPEVVADRILARLADGSCATRLDRTAEPPPPVLDDG